MRVVDLYKAVKTQLLTIHPRVYYGVADKNAAYPYLVIDLPNSIDGENYEDFVLDIDGWDSPADGSILALETLMHAADSVLHREILRSGNITAIVYRDNRLTLHDDESRIRRRKYIYQAKTYGG